MAKITGSEATIELLVNCKTYPVTAGDRVEIASTGGVQPNGEFVRLYPAPPRFFDPSQRYNSWDLIRVRAYRDDRDKRPETWHSEPDSRIEGIGHLATDDRRWDWMKKAVHESTAAMEAKGLTNGCVEIEPIDFYWEPDEKEWTPEQLSAIQLGMSFVSEGEMRSLAERVPWQFRLKYRERSTDVEGDLKVLQWGLYQGFRRDAKPPAATNSHCWPSPKERESDYSIPRGPSSRSSGPTMIPGTG